MIKTNKRFYTRSSGAWMLFCLLVPLFVFGQDTDVSDEMSEDIYEMSPFEVTTTEDDTYFTTTTLAGNRLSTDIRDLGTSLSIYNEQFMDDIGATDNQTLLKYTLGTEIGGVFGNYSGSGGGASPDKDASYLNPNSSNRVRGLVSADNTRDLYLSSIPWDGYNIEAVDIQRGPNAILFGQGSPGGVINTRTKQAMLFSDLREFSVRVDQYGSIRGALDLNQVILDDQLAIRFNAVYNATNFKQKPAFEDFDREYVAIRYQPKWFDKGDSKTIIKASYEMGASESNRPRNMPPEDRITPWFTDMNKQLYNAAWVNDNNWQIPGHGDAQRQDSDNNQNPNFQPWIGGNGTNYGNNYYGGSLFFFNPDTTTPFLAMAVNPVTYLGLNSLGERDGNIGGLAPSGLNGIASYRDWAITTGQPFNTLAKNTSITDPKIFDFYNKLLDGEIKREWYNFDTYDIQLSQTFFNDTLGFDIGYHDEVYNSGNYSPMIGGNGAIFVDFNTVMPDGTNTENGWYEDGTVNEGAGRPFIMLGNGEGRSRMDRQSLRMTAFATHNFTKNSDNWIMRLLGQHTITGMSSQDDSYRESQSWVKSSFVGDYYNSPFFEEIKDNNGRFWADFVPWRSVYVGDSLVSKNLGDDFGISGPSVDPLVGETATLRYFDSTWIATDVDPSAVWNNYVTAPLGAPAASTQAENPANYAGWVTKEVQLLTDSTSHSRDLLTTGRDWDRRYNDAYAFVWQGKFWDDSIIATAGWRHDEVGQDLVRWNRDESGADPTQEKYQTTNIGPIEKDSKSWGAVVHFDRLPFVGQIAQKLPVSISASYNKSENFQTGQVYLDYWGQDLPLPKGDTEDMGLVFATRDNRYSFKINKFKSSVSNNVSSGLQFWNYGNNIGIYASAYHQIKYNYESRGNPNSASYGSGIVSDLPIPTDGAPNPRWNFDYLALDGQTQAEAEALEVAVIEAYDQWLAELGPLPQLMAEAWSFAWDGSDFTEQGIAFRFTEDLVAEGYEFEFNAQVTDNWRVSVNGSRIESIRDNIGQTPAPGGQMTMMDYLLDFDRRMRETAMGDLRIWGPGGSADARGNWGGYADGDLKARLAEQGTVVPENRLWHWNLVTNYSFNDSKLEGLNIGGALRYQSASTLAYKPVQFPNYIGFDLDSPYRDEKQIDLDIWVGYRRKIWDDKVDWHCQLNITNVGVGNELVPVTVQADGTPASYRIRPSQYIFLTNTFKF